MLVGVVLIGMASNFAFANTGSGYFSMTIRSGLSCRDYGGWSAAENYFAVAVDASVAAFAQGMTCDTSCYSLLWTMDCREIAICTIQLNNPKGTVYEHTLENATMDSMAYKVAKRALQASGAYNIKSEEITVGKKKNIKSKVLFKFQSTCDNK